MGPKGKVYAFDVLPYLVDMTKRNVNADDPHLISTGIVEISVGDGWRGLPEHAPFDAIHVGAAASEIPPELMKQVRDSERVLLERSPGRFLLFIYFCFTKH